jgi:hypothetical protein
LGGEEIPRDDQVACGIAHAQTPEVDDGAEPALLDQQVKICQLYSEVTRFQIESLLFLEVEGSF